MKKKFGIIIAMLLCVVLALTFVACGNKDDGTSLKDVDAESIAEVDADISADIDRWLYNNASDVSTDLKTDLKAFLEESADYSLYDSKKNEIKPSVVVTYAAGKYTIVVTWKNGSSTLTKKYEKKEVLVKYNDDWAGSYDTATLADMTKASSTQKAGVVDNVVSALFAAINQTVSASVSGKFGVQGNIGVDVMGYDYGLDVKGNIDLSKIAENTVNNTNFGIALKNGDTNKVLGGLYYQNAAEDKDCKIYVGYQKDGTMTYKYLDYAILNQLFDKLKLYEKFNANKGNILPEGGLSDVLEEFGAGDYAGMVSSLMSKLIEAYTATSTTENNYVVDISFGSLFSTLSTQLGSLSGIVQGVLEDIPYLQDLDIATMHGLLGHITIAVTTDKNGNFKDFELAINIPECTFYFCADETKTHFDIPAISFAIYLKDFTLAKDATIQNVIPEAAVRNAEYFSPANINLQGDVYVNNNKTLNSTFRYHLATEINPFKPSQIQASFTIKQSEGTSFNPQKYTNFLTITYDQATKTIVTSGTAYEIKGDDKGEKLYTFAFESGAWKTIRAWLGINEEGGESEYGLNWNKETGVLYVSDATKLKDSAKALLDNDLVEYLLNYYSEKKTGRSVPTWNPNGQVAAANASDLTDGADDDDADFDIMANIGDIFDGLKSVWNKFADELAHYEDGSFYMIITTKDLNDLCDNISDIIGRDFIAFLNRKIPGANIPATLTDPEYIKIYVNTEDPDYQNKFYVTVKVGGDVYELTFDNDKDNDAFGIYFKLVKESTRTYTFNMVFNTEDNTVSVDYKVKASATATNYEENVQVVHSNFSINWGGRNDVVNNTVNPIEMYSKDALADAEAIFPADGTGVATKLVDGIMDLFDDAGIADIVKSIGRFVVRQVA